MKRPLPSDHLGSYAWTRRSDGILTRSEQLALARPLVHDELKIIWGLTVMALGRHPGRRSSIDSNLLLAPDSARTREVEREVEGLLSPTLLNHSRRAYAWGAALAALNGIEFDRELLYVAAMFHDTGLPRPVSGVDFTVQSAQLAVEFAERHGFTSREQEVIADAIALHHTPGVGLDTGGEAFLLSAGAGVDVFGLRAHQVPDAVREDVVRRYPRLGFKKAFAQSLRKEAKHVPHGRAWYLHRYAVSDLSIRLAPFAG
jgi:hypothetical protein